MTGAIRRKPGVRPRSADVLALKLLADVIPSSVPSQSESRTDALIAHLKLEIDKLRRALFGSRSERKARLLEQMELALEELEAAATEDGLAEGLSGFLCEAVSIMRARSAL